MTQREQSCPDLLVATRYRLLTRMTVAAALVLTVSLVAAWKFSALSPSIHVDEGELDPLLLAAIRNGDFVQVQSLLQQGADVNARTVTGDTALMQAALNADLPMMQLLLVKGADINARGADGTSALLRAVHDADKVRLLLRQGAQVEDRALVVAAWVPGSRRTLEMLLDAGANPNANVGGFTALMAAAFVGDLDSVTCLLDHGADVGTRSPLGYTALTGAAQSGNSAIVSVLLDRGTEANLTFQLPESNGDIQTPASLAALLGHVDCLRLLLDCGADVNVQGGPFQRTALIEAATTGQEEAVRLLLARGANLQAEDWGGDTALDWALRRGQTPIVRRLRAAGAREPSKVAFRNVRPRLQEKIDADPVARAIAASLPPLQHSAHKFVEKRNCITCHQHSLVAMTVGLARQRGLPVDEASATQARSDVQDSLRQRLPSLLLRAGIDPMLVPFSLVGLAAENQEPKEISDALVHYLMLSQQKDGRWRAEVNRPPDDASDFMATALAVRGLRRYAPPGRAREIERRLARARDWLVHAQPAETVDRVFQLLGLRWTDAAAESIRAAAQGLLSEQRPEGGWAQLPTLPSDAYATGQVLYALHEGGRIAVDDPVYRRGVDYLLRTQLADGSWRVPTRAFPVVEFTSSGFPHGASQFISAAGTCWATMALALTVSVPES
jgi:ankyrin repeat protein